MGNKNHLGSKRKRYGFLPSNEQAAIDSIGLGRINDESLTILVRCNGVDERG